MTRVETRKRKQPARPSPVRVPRRASASFKSTSTSDDSSILSEPESVEPPPKRRRACIKDNRKLSNAKPWKDIQSVDTRAESPTVIPPARVHGIIYHRPLLLDSRSAREALLNWFDGVSSSRLMPWRQPWIDPRTWKDDADGLRAALERRAYQVWISEIMLQQTRVAVVIDYWKRWMDRWPTIQGLATADAEDVLSAWRGLGYYSRATRIHQAAQLVVEDPSLRGLLPADARELKAKVPGIGQYTAGAISAIVFGRPEAMVDGNVIRVLSRQMGVHADFKASKSLTDFIWDAADALVKAVSSGQPDEKISSTDPIPNDRPGRWGQALMELGSTVCTPKPDCSQCPITSTCRAFAEGMMAANASNCREKPHQPLSSANVPDIEDVCSLCQPMDDIVTVGGAAAGHPSNKASSRMRKGGSAGDSSSSCSSPTDSGQTSSSHPAKVDQSTLHSIADYARRFPLKGLKKAVREQESLVCALRCGNSYLIQKRPAKGLLAGLWQLPSYEIPEGNRSTATSRKQMARSYVSELLSHLPRTSSRETIQPRHVGELGSVPWLFSHIRLTMHVHLFVLPEHAQPSPLPELKARWATDDEIETGSTMGTGMRKCWTMVKVDNGL